MKENEKIYLGDGAYVEYDGYQFRIYTSNGVVDTNEVFLEPQAMLTLIQFFNKLRDGGH